MWAASCLAFFRFLRSGEFTLQTAAAAPAIQVSDTAMDSHTVPSVVCIHLRKAKMDPFGRDILLYLGRTGTDICPVAALLNYLLIRPCGDGPMHVRAPGWLPHCFSNNSSLKCVKPWGVAGLNPSQYSGHSFQIGAATTAAAAGILDHLIKTLGCWESSAYMLYVRTPREPHAAVSAQLACQAEAAPPLAIPHATTQSASSTSTP